MLKETFRVVWIVLVIAAGSWLLAADRPTAGDLDWLAREVRALSNRIGSQVRLFPGDAGESVERFDHVVDRLERVVERLEDAASRLEGASGLPGTRGEDDGSVP